MLAIWRNLSPAEKLKAEGTFWEQREDGDKNHIEGEKMKGNRKAKPETAKKTSRWRGRGGVDSMCLTDVTMGA